MKNLFIDHQLNDWAKVKIILVGCTRENFFVFSPPEIHLMKKETYKTKKQNRSEVQEPLATYGISHNSVVINNLVIPDGYMSLEQFGEIFHQKLDASYENLQSNRKQ